MNKRMWGWGGWAIALAGVWPAWSGAAAFGADSVVVLRVGDGVASLTGNATPVFLDEFGLSGALRQTLALPTASSSDALTLRGTNSGEGAMSLSGDGRSLTLAGYGLAAGQRRTTTTPWTVASVSAAGEVALSTWSSLGSSPSLTAAGGSLTSPWIGTSQGLSSVNAVGTLAQSVQGGVQDLKSLGGQTWVALAGNSQRAAGIYAVSQAADGSVSVESVRAISGVTAFAMLDLNADIAGADTLYVASSNLNAGTNSLQGYKFTLRNAGVWGTGGTFELPSSVSFNGLVARAEGGQVQLMGTTSDSLLSLLDPWGYTDTSKGAFGNVHSWTTLATAATDTTFRGLALAPVAVPEASEAALALTGLGCCLLLARRRRAPGLITASTSSNPHAPAADGSAPADAARR
jgi:hypothetical protein